MPRAPKPTRPAPPPIAMPELKSSSLIVEKPTIMKINPLAIRGIRDTPITVFTGLSLSSVVRSEAAIVRSSCIFRTNGGVSDTAKELVANKERLKINTTRNFM